MKEVAIQAQLPFKGLVLSPDESVVSGFELPNNPDGSGGRAVLIFTQKNAYCCPLPRAKIGFSAMSADSVLQFPLAELKGAAKRWEGYNVVFANGRTLLVLGRDLQPLVKAINAVLVAYCGKEMLAVDEKHWEVRSTTIDTQAKQAVLAELETTRKEFLNKYTATETVHQLHASEARTSVFNAIMAVAVVIIVIIITIAKFSKN